MTLLRIYFFILFFCLTEIGTSQDLKLFSVRNLKKDFKEFVSIVEAHPAPYRHISEKDHKKLIKSIESQIKEDMNVIDFYNLIAPIYTSIKDGHSSIRLNFDWYKQLRKEYGVIPLKIYVDKQDKIYVISDARLDQNIPGGSEISHINGLTTQEYIEAVDPLISYELPNFRNSQIQESFNRHLLALFGPQHTTEITYMHQGEEVTQTVSHIDYDEWKDALSEGEEYKRKRIATFKPWDYKKLTDHVGYLNIFSFSIPDEEKYKFFLKKIFKDIKKDEITSLIIDVRGNTGGYPRDVSNLLHHITQRSFKTMDLSEMKVSQSYKDYFNEGSRINMYQVTIRRNNIHGIDINKLFGYQNGDVITQSQEFNEQAILENNEFAGELYLLTDKRTFSAASSLAATFKCYELGLILGEETGGTQVFHANSMYKQLKYTDLVAGMATTRLYTNCAMVEDQGVLPNIEVIPNVMHIVSGQDHVLNYALRVIKKVEKIKAEGKEK